MYCILEPHMLTLWDVSDTTSHPSRRLSSLRVPIMSVMDDNTEIPSLQVISEAQNRAPPPAQREYYKSDEEPIVRRNAQ